MIPRQEGSPPYQGAGAAPLLEVSGATKRYGANVVLSAVDFTVDAGDSIALIGENGAGKSTFAKIITGVTRPDAGAIRMNGKPVSFNSPRDALAHGIAFIPQELAYVPHLSVAENILLGHWPNRHGLTSRTMSLRQARDECRRFGVELDVAPSDGFAQARGPADCRNREGARASGLPDRPRRTDGIAERTGKRRAV